MAKKVIQKQKDNRARVWSFIVYPESAPQNWRDVLDKYHLAWVESPLHDKDKNPDGSVKKPHWHIVIFFEGKKSFEQIQEITSQVNAPIPQKVANPKGLVRYLIHMDNPEKYQYKREEILCHGGADIEKYFELSMSSRNEVLKEAMEFITDSEIDNYADFIVYCLKHNENDWFDIAVNHNTLAINKLIDAIYQRNHPKYDEPKNGSLDEKVAQVKQMRKDGVKWSVIVDTLGISLATAKRYLKK
ncbi:Rep family protein [Ligilactobacillus salivarius]|uniref:Rep family protein n=1 Tax=Ligilactobacillus salivarius TaxID=1624 RepID=UPI00263AC87B|nr:Rep family protein [Ligilactobacillus salivarius]MDN4849175.1 Rep family protein [Ligilactobacillus salivarius]